MTFAAVVTVLTVLGVLALLVHGRWGADSVLLAGLGVLLVTGVVPAKEGLSGFANEGMLTVAALFVVAAGLKQTGAMSRLAGTLLGGSGAMRITLARLCFPAAAMSAVLNNTPIVAALLPAVSEWCHRRRLAASKFLIPLSYATVLGGTITVIGTSTNLVVTGLVEKNLAHHPGLRTIGIFDISPIGLAVTAVGCLTILLLAPVLLPDRRPVLSRDDDPRNYTSEFVIPPQSPLVGRSIEAAGLRSLPGAFLMEVARDGTVLNAVDPQTRLAGGDRLVFAGPRESVVDLKRIPGLVPAPDQVFRLKGPDGSRCLVEAVVAPSNPLAGRSIREGRFRDTFNAVVVALARDGQRVGGRIGDIVVHAGDILLLEAHPSWVKGQRGRRNFYLVSEVEDSSSFRHDRAWIALIVLAGMVGAAALSITSMFLASITAAALMVLLGCCQPDDARRSIELPTLLTIAASFGIGEAIRLSGTDRVLAEAIVGLGASTPLGGLVALYVATAILTEVITNNAAAALMFPFSLSLADRLDASPMPFCVAVMFAASASFSTPIGYQTNLMVYGPGGYRFTDFMRVGLPLQAVTALVTCSLVPWVFPFGR